MALPFLEDSIYRWNTGSRTHDIVKLKDITNEELLDEFALASDPGHGSCDEEFYAELNKLKNELLSRLENK